MQKLLSRGSQYVVRVTRVCRTRSASHLSTPGAGYPQPESSEATFEVYLGIATASRAVSIAIIIMTKLKVPSGGSHKNTYILAYIY